MAFATKTVGEAMPVYDAVVIGSGYGGGVAASCLARMGLRLAILALFQGDKQPPRIGITAGH
jgi:cholesterol oxidase